MINIKYRKSVKNDVSEINNLFIEMVKHVNNKMIDNGITPYEQLENGYEDGYLDKFYVDDNNVIFVAEHNNNIIGFISLCLYKEESYVYVDDYCVKEEYRGYGIGSKLMEMAVIYAKEKEIRLILTHVESTNKDAIDFYFNKSFELQEKQDNRLLIKKSL